MSANALPPSPAIADYLRQFWLATGGDPAHLARVAITGEGALPSVFAVTEFATAAIGAAGLAMAEFAAAGAGGAGPDSTGPGAIGQVTVDRRLASIWFGTTLRPVGWSAPPLWDAVAGDYRAADGWIRLHTNAPHHRDAALAVLGVAADRDAVAQAVSRWRADELEAAVVARNGCAAAMRGIDAWRQHPQGRGVAEEPLLHRDAGPTAARPHWRVRRQRPLQGLRVLDLTRILAGPVATRFLAGYGADVLRIDPPGWEEPGTVPEVVLGKRCARLDLKSAEGLATLERLLVGADVLIHGYRADALARLGLDAERRRQLNPTLVDVSLDAYGWSGPLAGAPRLRQPGADEHRHRRGRHARQRRRPSGAAAVPGARPRHRLSDGGRGDPRVDRTACDGRRRQRARVVGPQRAIADHAWRHAGRRAGAGPGKRSGLVRGDRGNVMGPGPARQAAHVDRRHARVVGLPGERAGLIRSGLAGRGAIGIRGMRGVRAQPQIENARRFAMRSARPSAPR